MAVTYMLYFGYMGLVSLGIFCHRSGRIFFVLLLQLPDLRLCSR